MMGVFVRMAEDTGLEPAGLFDVYKRQLHRRKSCMGGDHTDVGRGMEYDFRPYRREPVRQDKNQVRKEEDMAAHRDNSVVRYISAAVHQL